MEGSSPPPSPTGSVASCVAESGTPRAPCLSPEQTPRVSRPPLPRSVQPSGGKDRASSAGTATEKRSEQRRPQSDGRNGVGIRTPSEPPCIRGGNDGSPPGDRGLKTRSSSTSVRLPRLGDAPPPVERKDVGKVPVYLKRRQEEIAEEKRRALRPPSPQPPPGYRLVGEDERQATLSVLRQRKLEVEQAQNSLPFKIETVGQRQREKELTDRLGHVNRLTEMFGQPVVFVPAHADPLAQPGPTPPARAVQLPAERAGQRSPNVASETSEATSCSGARMSRAGSSEPHLRRQASRESRAAASRERRRQMGVAVPWDQLQGGSAAVHKSAVHTEVKVAEPPGGRSSLQLH